MRSSVSGASVTSWPIWASPGPCWPSASRSLTAEGVLDGTAGAHGHTEYVLTGKGITLWPVVRSLLAWGDEHYSDGGPRRVFQHAADGGAVNGDGTCATCGQAVAVGDLLVAPGPGLAPGRAAPTRSARSWRPRTGCWSRSAADITAAFSTRMSAVPESFHERELARAYYRCNRSTVRKVRTMGAADEDLLALPDIRAARLAGVSVRRLRYWEERELVVPSIKRSLSPRNTVRLYSYQDLLALLVVATLRTEREMSLQHIRRVVAHLQARGYAAPLREVKFATLGQEIYFQHPAVLGREI